MRPPGSAGPASSAAAAGDRWWRAPRYGERTLAELLPSVAAVLGASGRDDVLGLSGHLSGVRRVVVLLVDGLGRHNLAAALAAPGGRERYPALAGLADPIGGLDAVAPSTTPANLASLSTGSPPGAHGIVGFTVAIPGGGGRRLTHIAWEVAKGPDPVQWQPLPSVLAGTDGGATGEETETGGATDSDAGTGSAPANGAGGTGSGGARPDAVGGDRIGTTTVGPESFRGSGLTEAIYRNVRFRGTFSAGDVAATAVAAARSAPRTLTYAYHGDLDTIGHLRGWQHPSWAAELGQVDRLIDGLLRGLPTDAALLVTADHGMRTVPDSHKLDLDGLPDVADGLLADLNADVEVIAGEPRARYLHVRPGTADAVAARWRERLGSDVLVLLRDEAIDLGLFGPTVTADAAARIGDVTAWSHTTTLTLTRREPPVTAALACYHGSLSDEELAVPLLLGRP